MEVGCDVERNELCISLCVCWWRETLRGSPEFSPRSFSLFFCPYIPSRYGTSLVSSFLCCSSFRSQALLAPSVFFCTDMVDAEAALLTLQSSFVDLTSARAGSTLPQRL